MTRIVQSPEANLGPVELAQLAALQRQRYRLPWPYFSKVKFVATRTGEHGGPYVYTVPTGRRRAFSYSIDQLRIAAGYTQADGVATPCDTNLTAQSQTTSGEEVAVRGIAITPMPAGYHRDDDSDPHTIRPCDYSLLAALDGAVSCELVMNSNQRYNLGLLHFLAGAAGFCGGSPDLLGPQALAGANKALPYSQNGWPVRSNYMRIPDGFVWRPSGEPDAQLNVVFEVQRQVTLYSGGSPENNLSDVAADNAFDSVATGTEGYSYPEQLIVELAVELIGVVTSGRSTLS
jgi:hypothetical protein